MSSSAALENRVVVQRILSYFSAAELLDLSTVNKLWNQEARTLLRDHRKCVAFIKGRTPCSRAKILNDQMAIMGVVPFNVLSIEISSPHKCPTGIRHRGVEQLYVNLINKMNLKQFRILWGTEGSQKRSATDDCILGQLILRFLLTGSAKLEGLQIDWIPLNVRLRPLNQPNQACLSGFPNLKTFELPWKELLKFLSNLSIQEFISVKAPNLQVLHNKIRLDWVHLIPAEKFRIIKKLDFPQTLRVNEELLSVVERFSESEPKLWRASILSPAKFTDRTGIQSGRFFRLLWRILRSSCDTLKAVHIDTFNITLLTASAATEKLGLQPLQFPNVTTLLIYLREGEDPGIDATLLRLPMQQAFPSVTEVLFVRAPVRRIPLPRLQDEIPWPAVTKVRVDGQSPLSPLLRGFQRLFPSLESVEISEITSDEGEPPFPLLWASWPRLKHLQLGEEQAGGWMTRGLGGNFDAEFCGIHPQEAQLLRQMDDEYLKAVHIVPIFPAINHLRDLRQVKMGIELEDSENDNQPEPEPSGDLFFSKVTRYVGLRTMNDFKLRLVVPVRIGHHLEHLREWVEVYFRESPQEQISRQIAALLLGHHPFPPN